LRDEVLRRPLRLSLRDEDLSKEKDQLHFGLFEPNGNLVGCVIAVPLSPAEARIRQMAVSPSHQGRGAGSRIMDELEATLEARGFEDCVLDARVSAAGFYDRLGYRIVGEPFLEVTVRHVRMVKNV
jgi:ribosomal protein S18 acetylase RimI-like enzyme